MSGKKCEREKIKTTQEVAPGNMLDEIWSKRCKYSLGMLLSKKYILNETVEIDEKTLACVTEWNIKIFIIYISD